MFVTKVRKYKNSRGYKVQMLSDYSIFPINGGTKEKNQEMEDILVAEAKAYVERNNIENYVIEDYREPNYGIMGINIRVFNTKEALEKYADEREKIQIRAAKELQEYLIEAARCDKIRQEKAKEDEKLLKKLYTSRIKDIDKLNIGLPFFDAMCGNCYRGTLTVSIKSDAVEKVLNDIKANPELAESGRVLGQDYLNYKVVNKIIKWVNNHTSKYHFDLIDKKYRVRLPMAYCELDNEKYPYGSAQRDEAYRKLIRYSAVAYDIYIAEE